MSRNRIFLVIKFIITFVCCMYIIVIIFSYIQGFSISDNKIIGLIIAIINVFVIPISTIYEFNKYNQEEQSIYEQYLIGELKRKIEHLEKQISESQERTEESNTNILLLMLKNSRETTEYFKISKSHSKSAHIFSIISCIFGFILLSLAILAFVVTDRVEISIIGTVSGAITEVIAGTVLVINNKSASQLNHYYDALHQNEKFLSAVNLADKLSDSEKEKIYIEIIRKQIEIQDEQKQNE